MRVFRRSPLVMRPGDHGVPQSFLKGADRGFAVNREPGRCRDRPEHVEPLAKSQSHPRPASRRRIQIQNSPDTFPVLALKRQGAICKAKRAAVADSTDTPFSELPNAACGRSD